MAFSWHGNMLGYLSVDIICSSKLLGTDNVQGQIFQHIFAPNGGYCVYCPSNIFATCTVLKIGEYPRIFSHMKHLNQSHERKYLMDYNVWYHSLTITPPEYLART